MPIQLYSLKEFAKELGESWDRQKIIEYYQQGKLPEPYAISEDNPLWTKEQIRFFKFSVTK